MSGKVEFLNKLHDHVLESIKMADQKAAAVIAIGVGVFYVLNEILRNPALQPSQSKLGKAAQVLLLLSIGFALLSIYPPSGFVDSHIKGGEHLRPNLVISEKLPQEDFKSWLLEANDNELATEMADLIYARMTVRASKYFWVGWSVIAMGISIVAIFIIVVRLRPGPPPEFKTAGPPDQGGITQNAIILPSRAFRYSFQAAFWRDPPGVASPAPPVGPPPRQEP